MSACRVHVLVGVLQEKGSNEWRRNKEVNKGRNNVLSGGDTKRDERGILSLGEVLSRSGRRSSSLGGNRRNGGTGRHVGDLGRKD